MSTITTINEYLQLEIRVGLSGTGVDAIISTGTGSVSNQQVFWSETEEAARAFIRGVAYMNGIN